MFFRRMSPAIRLYFGLVAFSLFGTWLTSTTRSDATFIARPTAILTLMCGCYAAFAPTVAQTGWRAPLGFLGVLVIGTASEVVGLATGEPFGRYRYTQNWWPTVYLHRIGEFPLLLPIAWVLMVGSAYLFLAQYLRAYAVVACALMCALLDQVMEPAMSQKLRYWVWIDHGPLAASTPVANAVGWLCVSLIAACVLRLALGKQSIQGTDAGLVLAGHVVLTLGVAYIG